MDFGSRYTELETLHTETNLRIHVGVTLTPFVKNLWLTPGCTIDAHEPAQPQIMKLSSILLSAGLMLLAPLASQAQNDSKYGETEEQQLLCKEA